MKCEPHCTFEHDEIEVSTVSTENNLDVEESAGNAQEYSHLIYHKDGEVTYMAQVPNNGKLRDSSLTHNWTKAI